MDSIILLSDTPRKQCTACEEWKDAISDNFYANIQGKYGLYARCIECFRSGRHPVKKPRKERLSVPKGHRICSSCREVFPATEVFFPASSLTSTSRLIRCIECEIIYQQHVIREQPEIVPDGFKKCHKCKKIKLATEDFFYRHKSEGRKKGKLVSPCISCDEAKRLAHTEETKQYSHLHYMAHPEQYIAKSRNRDARKKQVAGIHTDEQIQEQLKRQRYCCYYAACGFARFPKIKGKYIYVIEHTFPLARVAGTDIPANSIDYLVLACPSCNAKKGKKFPWEWPAGGRLL